MTRLRVAVIYGGRGPEHEVSRRSASAVLRHLDRERYDVLPVRITTEGHWVVEVDHGAGHPVPEWAEAAAEADAWQLLPPLESMMRLLGVIGTVDVAFPCLHGSAGADGSVQGVLRFAGVPHVGSRVAASAAAVDREVTRKLLAAEGLPVVEAVALRGSRDTLTAEEQARVGLPAFVKPARRGPRLAISRVTGWRDLPPAVALARGAGNKVLVERERAGREISVGVLEHPDGRLTTSVDPAADPAPDEADAVAATAVRAFELLGCAGLLRAGLLVDRAADGRVAVTVDEVDTLPGLTEESPFPRMWEVAGLAYPRLLDLLLETANRRGRSLTGNAAP